MAEKMRVNKQTIFYLQKEKKMCTFASEKRIKENKEE